MLFICLAPVKKTEEESSSEEESSEDETPATAKPAKKSKFYPLNLLVMLN